MKNVRSSAAVLTVAFTMTAAGIDAADYRKNPFTLTYGGAITENVAGRINIHPVTFKLNGLEIAAKHLTVTRG